MLWYKRLESLFYTDTFYSKQAVSKLGFSIMQIFVSDNDFVKMYGMKYRKEFVKALNRFCKEMGAPKSFIFGLHTYKKSNEVWTFLNKVGIILLVLEESTHHFGRAELYIGLMNIGVGKDMREKKSPMQLWCYEYERRDPIMTLTAKNIFQL